MVTRTGNDIGGMFVTVGADLSTLKTEMREGAQVTRQSTNQITQSVEASSRAITRAGQRVQQSSGLQRNAMRQLSFQVGDVSSQFAAGVSPMMIFAQQGDQVRMAVTDLYASKSRLAAFMGGPWGAALTGAVTLLGFLGTAALSSADDMDTLADSADNAATRIRAALAEMGSFGQGDYNTAFIQAFDAQGDLRRAQAEMAAVREMAEGRGPRVLRLGDGRTIAGQFAAQSHLNSRDRFGARAIVDAAQARANETGSLMNEAEAVRAGRAQAARFEAEERAANRASRSRSGGSRGRSEAERAAAREARNANTRAAAIATSDRNILQARLQQATTAAERLEIEQRLIDLAEQETLRRIQANEAYDQTTKDQLTHNAMVVASMQRSRVQRNALEASREAELEATQTIMRSNQDRMRAELSITESASERMQLELQILDTDFQIAEQRQLQLIANREITEAERQAARIALQNLRAGHSADRQAVANNYAGPLAQFRRGIPEGAEEINASLEEVAAKGLAELNEGLVDAVLNAESLGDAFSKVADQIIADILRIAIQQAVIAPLAGLLGNLIGGGISGGLGGGGVGPSSGPFGFPLQGRAVGGAAVAGRPYAVGAGELFVPSQTGRVLSRADAMRTASGGGGVTVVQHFDNNFAGGAATQDDVARMGAIARESAIAGVFEAQRRGG